MVLSQPPEIMSYSTCCLHIKLNWSNQILSQFLHLALPLNDTATSSASTQAYNFLSFFGDPLTLSDLSELVPSCLDLQKKKTTTVTPT